MPTATQTVLPATGRVVPNAEWAVSSIKQHDTRNGVSFAAKVRRNGRIVGQFENEGMGGASTFSCTVAIPETRDADGKPSWDFSENRAMVKAWGEYVASFPDEAFTYHRTANGQFLEADETHDPEVHGAIVETSTWDVHSREDMVMEWLMAEYELLRAIKRFVKKGETPVRFAEHEAGEFATYRTSDVKAVAKAAIAHAPADNPTVWVDGAWVAASAV